MNLREGMNDMEEKRLKRCPFCGGEAVLKKYSGAQLNKTVYWVTCSKCFTRIGTIKFSETEAIDLWNNRVNV
jgi:Lar family restriction alleviation protein